MKTDQLLKEAALERPGVGMPLAIVHMTRKGWVPSIDEYLEQDNAAWSIWFLLLYQFFKAKDHLALTVGQSSRVVPSRWPRKIGFGRPPVAER